jgi:hypothetical protein
MPAPKREPVRLALAHDPALVAEIARRILNAHFPESIREDVADAVGLSLDAENAATPEQAQGRECLPHAEFLAWHRAEVYKEPVRE